MNIATSVVNRILNAIDDLESVAHSPPSVPSVPDAGPLGEVIDTTIAEPSGPMTQTDPMMTEDLVTGPLFR